MFKMTQSFSLGSNVQALACVLLISALCLLSSCGFQFAAFEQLGQRWQVVYLNSEDATAFDQRLIQRLSDLGIVVKDHVVSSLANGSVDEAVQVGAEGVHLSVGKGQSTNNQTLGNTTETRLYTYAFTLHLHLQDSKAHQVIDKAYTASTEVQFAPNQMRLSSAQLNEVRRLLYDQVISQFFSDVISGRSMVEKHQPVQQLKKKSRLSS